MTNQTSSMKNFEEKLKETIQNEIASEVIYESRHAEEILQKCLVNLEKKLLKLFQEQRNQTRDEGYDARGVVEAKIKDTMIKQHEKKIEKIKELIKQMDIVKYADGKIKPAEAFDKEKERIIKIIKNL